MMKEGEYNNMPVAGLAGLPPNPAGPGDIGDLRLLGSRKHFGRDP